jgi:hypothetical protein
MTSLTPAERVDALLSELEGVEAVSFDLGTPDVFEHDAVRQLVAMGTEAVPHLLERMQGDAPKKRVVYIALALNRIGDVRALAPLADICRIYQQRATKDQWDYAVLVQCKLAIEQLEKKKAP